MPARVTSDALYVSVPTTVVDWTVKVAQPAVAACGLLVTSVVEAVAPVKAVRIRLIESVEAAPEVTLLPEASRTHTVTLEVETPLAGIGFGVNVGAPRFVAAPKPVKEAVPVAVPPVKAVDEPVASQTCATASLIVNFTVEPVAPAVVAVAGLPAPPAGVVLSVVAEQSVVVPVLYRFRVIGVTTKTGLPEASWTWKVT